jgi:hypothetical protein
MYTDPVAGMVEIAQAEDPDAPDAFRFALPGKLAGILENADAKNVTERQLNFEIKAAISFDQFWQLRNKCPELCGKKWPESPPVNYQP